MVLSLALVTALASCRPSFEDVSEEAPYSALIGRRYQLVKDLLIHGVTDDLSGSRAIDYYVVTERPGIDGPEVLSRDPLKSGILIEIENVSVCTNCFESGIHLEIDILSNGRYKDHPVTIHSAIDTGSGTLEVLAGIASRVE